MNTIFQTFKRGGIRFLALPADQGSVHIVDEHGYNYGSYHNIEAFDNWVLKQTDTQNVKELRLGCARVGVTQISPIPKDDK